MKILFILSFTLLLILKAYSQFNIEHLMREGVKDIIENRYTDGIKKFNTILSVKPDDWKSLYLRGIAKFYLGDIYGAQKDFDKGINVNPVFSEFYLLRGGTYQMQSEYSAAMSDYNKAEELDPANPSVYVNKGLIKAVQEDFTAGVKLLTKAIEMKPDYSDSYLYRGFCYIELKEFEKAASDISKAIALNKFDERAFIWRGKLQYDKKEFEFAIQDFSRALAISPENPLVFYYRALTYYEIGDFKNAIQDLDSVIHFNPQNDLAYYNRALIKQEIGATNDALSDFNQVINLKPDNILAHFNKAVLLYDRKEYFTAIDAFSQAIKLYPDFIYAYLYRADAKMNIGKTKEANSDYLLAENIKKQNGGSEFGDTVKFKKLIKFDADFVKNNDRELLAIGKILKQETTVMYAGDFFINFVNKKEYSQKYYNSYLTQVNKTINGDYIFVAADSVNLDNYLVNVDSLIDSLHITDFKHKYMMQSVAAANAENYNTAKENCSKLIASDSKYALAYFNRARINSKVIDMLRAFDEIPQEISIISKTISVDSRIKTTATAKYNEYADVVADYSKVIELQPDFFYAYYNRANVKCKTLNFPEAIVDYTKAIDLNESFAEAYFNRGLTYMKLNDTENACIDLSKSGELGMEDVYLVLRKYCK